MKKELFGITREDAADSGSYILEYYLIEQNMQSEQNKTYTAYGVEIRKLIPCGTDTIEETSIVSDIFPQRSKTEQFIRLLTDCKVTPVHLKDIALDFIQSPAQERQNILCSA